jgi:lambda family phage tail tape measure protein
MPTIAELQIKVDAVPIEKGTKALNDFAVAAEKASTATDKKRVSDESLATASKKVATEADNTAKAAERQNKEFEALLGKIDPITKKLNDLAKQESTLFANKGNLSTAAFDSYNAKIQESLEKILGLGQAQTKVAQTSTDVPDRLQKIAQAAYNAAQGQENLTTALRGASEAEQGLVSSGAVEASNQRADAALKEYNAKRNLTDATTGAATAQRSQSDSLQDLLTKIDPATKKLNELDRLQKELSKQRDLGFIDNDTFTRYNNTIELSRQATSRFSEGLQNSGKTAKETAFALRGLPAQFTDIVVSLQGGQAPLTVLLQQGGQIKDMFGGIAPALRAVGGALVAMITPVTVGAAAVGALAVAAYSGSQELTAFNRALTLTNNVAGVSASQFSQYRDALDSTVTTSGKAAEALTLIAAGGKVAGDQFVAVAESAVLFEKATGQAITETIADFNALGKDPVDAAIRLDEKYRFLTASVLEQARALVEVGNESDASALLQDKLAEATTSAATKVIEQAGYMETAWNKVKGAITGTWDVLKSIGRDNTTSDNLKDLQEANRLIELQVRGSQNIQTTFTEERLAKDKIYQQNKVAITQLEQRIQYEKLAADQQRETEQARTAQVSGTNAALKLNESGLDAVSKAEKRLSDVRLQNQKILDASKVTGDDVSAETRVKLAQNEAKAVEDVAKAKEKANKTPSTPIDTRGVSEVRNNLKELTAEYDGYYKKVTALGEANIVSAEATYQSQKAILEAQKDAVSQAYDAQVQAIKDLQGNKKNSASQNISLENQLSKAESDRVVALEKLDTKQEELQAKEKGRLDKRTASISAYKAALDAQLESLSESGSRAVENAGRGDAASVVATQLADNDRSFDKQQRQLAKSLGEGMDPTEYATNLKNLQDAHTAMTEQILQNNEDLEASNADWTNGFTKAVENAAADGRNFAKATETAVSGAFDSMGDALATFVTTGKLDFKSLALSIISDLAKIAARTAASQALSSLFGVASSALGGVSTGVSAATTSGFSEYGQITTQAKGGGWDGGKQFFAQGGTFTNSIVSAATSFPISGGKTGVMGEAGPEAIVPLARAADGSLGVRQIGGSDSKGGVVVYVTITGDGATTETSDAGYQGFGKEIGDYIDNRYRTLQEADLRSGGVLNRAIKET